MLWPVYAASPVARVDSLSALIEEHYLSKGSLARGWVGQLYRIADEYPGDNGAEVKAVYYESLVEHAQGKSIFSLIPRIDSLLIIYPEYPYLHENAILTYSRSLANITQGNYAEAFQDAVQALEKIEKLNDNTLLFRIFNLFGSLYRNINDSNMADYYFNRALELTSPERSEYYYICINKYGLFYFHDDKFRTIDSLLTLLPKIEAHGDTTLWAFSCVNMGTAYGRVDDNEKAYYYFKKALDLSEKADNEKFFSALYQNLGNYYYHEGDYRQAYIYSVKAKDISTTNGNFVQLSYALQNLSRIFEEIGNSDSALYYMHEHQKLYNYLINNPKMIEVYRFYFSMAMKTAEDRLKITEQELQLKRKQNSMVVIILAAIILTIGLLFVITLQNRRNIKQRALLREAENKELSKQLQQEHKIQRLQSEKLESQIREMTSYSLLISSKNNILQQILELSEQPSENKAPDVIFDKIRGIVKSNLNTDSDWNNFIIHFDQVHPRFFEKLNALSPELTQNDLKLAAYLRIGLSIKQIAQMINITTESIKANRYRLRKKLNLKKEENLDEFIQAI